MKHFRNLKIKTKLISSYLLIAFMGTIIGGVGLLAITNTNKKMDEITKVSFPATTALLAIAEAQASMNSVEKALLSDKVTGYIRDNQYTNFDLKLKEAEESLDIYGELPKTKNEEYEWDKFLVAWEEWREDVDKIIALAKEYDQLSIADFEARKSKLELMARISSDTNMLSYIKVSSSLKRLIVMNNVTVANTNLEVNSTSRLSIIILIVTIIVGFSLSIVLAFFIARVINKPIKKVLKAADKIAQGELDVHLDVNSKDEIGEMAKTFQLMVNNLNETMTDINFVSEQVADKANQLSNSSSFLAQGATEQASSIEQLTTSIEEISAQIKNNALNTSKAKNITNKVQDNVSKGNIEMQKLLVAIDEITISSNNISKIIKVIDGIAFQTNILALNAAVEAARAGQHGKGFAVVAEEVRNLAVRSSNAAKETASLIENSLNNVKYGIKTANITAEALNEIVDGSKEVDKLIGGIAIASNEQSIAINQVNQGIMQITNVVQAISATAEETAASSEELSSQSVTLKEKVSTFKLKSITESLSNFDIENESTLEEQEILSEEKLLIECEE
ncbi:methyl-accepting chemotaxis protein [Clostridium grantii]|uniref:Methyl-accepting chemotaxis protein n=1 Tax=Clostridium grantii DSM 8605 TaxID=1121316 RepID=A0A1M5V6H8_9CLOT|nr:methyl-accepting chemotaxis protein [Clostridium grantii]SHH70825.1 methyl-accepting chemotaxis protein [Clostridium grantii DSM 8605]